MLFGRAKNPIHRIKRPPTQEVLPPLKLIPGSESGAIGPPKPKPIKVSGKEERFCQEYAYKQNGRQAAIAAGWKPVSAGAIARQLRQKPKILARIEQIQDEALESYGVHKHSVLREHARIGFSDIREAMDENGHLLPVGEWSDKLAAAVASVEITSYKPKGTDEPIQYTHKFKFWDKGKALNDLGKHLGIAGEDEGKVLIQVNLSAQDVGGF